MDYSGGMRRTRSGFGANQESCISVTPTYKWAETIGANGKDIQARRHYKFWATKVCTIIMKKGKREEYDGVTLPNGEMMKDLGQDDYKYLGVLEENK